MEKPVAIAISPLGIVISTVAWAILFAVILDVLKRRSPFEGWTVYVIALCVSLLSVIGIFRFPGPLPNEGAPRNQDEPFTFLLLPYAAMGISMLIVLLLRVFTRIRAKGDETAPGDRQRMAADIGGGTRDSGPNGSKSRAKKRRATTRSLRHSNTSVRRN